MSQLLRLLHLRLTQKADVYALGIISYQVYTGQDPHLECEGPSEVVA